MTDVIFCEPCDALVLPVHCAKCNTDECENCNAAYGCEQNI